MCGSVVSTRYELFEFYCFFFQAEDGIRDLVRSRGLGDVYKRQFLNRQTASRRERLSLQPGAEPEKVERASSQSLRWRILRVPEDAARGVTG